MKNTIKIDEIDIKILEVLQSNGRISNIELSNIVGISPSPCLRRLKSLQDNGVIKGYFADIEASVFNYNITMFASVSIDVKNESEKNAFETALANIPEIREIYALSLETDYLLKFKVKDWLDYKNIINTKVAKVPFLKRIRTTHITRVIKKEYGFPLGED